MQALLSLQSDTLLRLCLGWPHLLFEPPEDANEGEASPRAWNATGMALLLRQHAPWSLLELVATLSSQVHHSSSWKDLCA